jgi:WhiB family transcriptional regulator, redox-sensing transcriptional regulator
MHDASSAQRTRISAPAGSRRRQRLAPPSMVDDARAALTARPASRWWDHGHCKGHDTELFMADDHASVGAAKALCADCDVRIDCLGDVLRAPLVVGVWGGTTAREREVLRSLLTARQSAVFDEADEAAVPAGAPDRPDVAASDDAPAASAPDTTGADGQHDPAEPPAWAAVTASGVRWEHLGDGPGPSGHWTVGGIEVVVRATASGYSAYSRLARRRADAA